MAREPATIPGSVATLAICFTAGKKPPPSDVRSHASSSSPNTSFSSWGFT